MFWRGLERRKLIKVKPAFVGFVGRSEKVVPPTPVRSPGSLGRRLNATASHGQEKLEG